MVPVYGRYNPGAALYRISLPVQHKFSKVVVQRLSVVNPSIVDKGADFSECWAQILRSTVSSEIEGEYSGALTFQNLWQMCVLLANLAIDDKCKMLIYSAGGVRSIGTHTLPVSATLSPLCLSLSRFVLSLCFSRAALSLSLPPPPHAVSLAHALANTHTNTTINNAPSRSSHSLKRVCSCGHEDTRTIPHCKVWTEDDTCLYVHVHMGICMYADMISISISTSIYNR